MLLHGMPGIKKRVWIISSIALLCILSVLLFILFYRLDNRGLDSKQYYEKLVLQFETESLVKTKDVFDFAFDKAYVTNEIYGDEEYFLKKLNVGTSIDIPTLESGTQNRILFIKDDRIIYDFIYEMKDISISETEIWIFPDTTMSLTLQHVGDNGRNVLQIEFIE